MSGVTMFIGQWDSDYMMRNDLSGAQLDYYAASTNGNVVTAFASMHGGKQPLEPLTQFGFVINKLP